MRNALSLYNGGLRRLFDLDKDFGKTLNQFWGSDFDSEERENHFLPAVDIQETKDKYFVSFDLPGISKEDLKIRLESNVLVVSGERKREKEEKGENNFTHIERFYGTFQRSFTLPDSVDSENVDADYKDGILKISIPKKESTKPKLIPVK